MILVTAHASKDPNRIDRIGARVKTIAASATFSDMKGRVNSAMPVQEQFRLTAVFVDVGYDFEKKGSSNPLLETNVRLRVFPRMLQLAS